MAEVDAAKTPTLAEHYFLKGGKEEKVDVNTKSAAELEVKNPANETSEEVVTTKTEEDFVVIESNEVPSAAADESNEASLAAADESSGATSDATGENNAGTPVAGESVSEATQTAAEEGSGSAEQEDSGDGKVEEETTEVKLETAPVDFRFPTTNQTRHCFTRYVEYHRCVAAKGEGAPECDKFAKYYRSLCPGEWIERWNEQRENGTFPGPL